MSAALKVDTLSVVYDEFHALKDVSIDVEGGESFGLVGESRLGKIHLAARRGPA